MGKKLRQHRKETRHQKTDTKAQKKRERKVNFIIPGFFIPKDEPIALGPFSPIDYAGGILVFFICWAVYLHTLTPTIGLHDSGDMITAAYVLGIPHSTGYPLYCLLGKLWMTILPIGNIAYRMNLASALCASLACVMVYFIILKVGSMKLEVRSEENKSILHFSFLIPAIVGALMLAFATTFWEQAVIAEKYTFNALFATLLIFILLKWQEAVAEVNRGTKEGKNQRTKEQITQLHNKLLYLFAFTLGLSFTHHMQTIYLVPASILFILSVLWKHRKSLSTYYLPLTTMKMFCCFILPLFLYLYLPIRAVQNPPIMWGEPDTFGGFIEYITGKEFRELYSIASISEFIRRGYTHISCFFVNQFTWYIIWFGIIGILVIIKNRINIFLFMCVLILTDLFYAIQYPIPNIEDYYIPSFAIFSIYTGVGISYLLLILRKKVTIYLLGVTFLFLPIIPFVSHYEESNQRHNYSAYDYGVNVLKPLRENSLVDVGSIAVFSPWYLRYVENLRVDVDFLERFFLHCNWYLKKLKSKHLVFDDEIPKKNMTGNELGAVRIDKYMDIVLNNFEKLNIYIYLKEEVSKIEEECTLIPEGLFHRVMKKNLSRAKLSQEIDQIKVRFIYRAHRYVSDKVKSMFLARGAFYNNIYRFDKAIIEFNKALKLDPTYQEAYKNLSNAYFNLGIISQRKKMYNKAIEYYKKAIKMDTTNNYAKQMLQTIISME
ncbi:MAG: DUF2723 domain-containing protein [bacterium]